MVTWGLRRECRHQTFSIFFIVSCSRHFRNFFFRQKAVASKFRVVRGGRVYREIPNFRSKRSDRDIFTPDGMLGDNRVVAVIQDLCQRHQQVLDEDKGEVSYICFRKSMECKVHIQCILVSSRCSPTVTSPRTQILLFSSARSTDFFLHCAIRVSDGYRLSIDLRPRPVQSRNYTAVFYYDVRRSCPQLGQRTPASSCLTKVTVAP